MTVSRLPLNRSERVMFGIAVVLAFALLLCRVGYMILVSYLHQVR